MSHHLLGPPGPSYPAATSADGWHSRGYLPHFDSPHAVQHVTFRLADSLPAAVLASCRADLHRLPPDQRATTLRRRLEAWIDTGHGSCLLREPAAAELVEAALLAFDAVRYRLLAWVVMPNHVHVLVQPCEGWPLGGIVSSWKSFTGRRLPSRSATGAKSVWQREYWDRFVRDEAHLVWVRAYIHQNPVKAGLVPTAEAWRWSSAWWQRIG